MRMAVVLLLLFAWTACAGSSNGARNGAGRQEGGKKLERYEEYVENPTEIVGDEATVILPDFYADELVLKGLSSGWVEESGKRAWVGSGDCRLELRSLRIHCKLLTVTLVPPGDEPEVLIQATGNVTLAQQVKGVGSWFDNLILLTIRNERMRMMER